MFEWMPYFANAALALEEERAAAPRRLVDSYSYHCGLAPMLHTGVDIAGEGYDFDLVKKMLDIWRRAAGLILDGDYYLLTPNHRTPEKWVARQFDSPETGRGFVQGIRLPACAEETLVVHPKAMRADAVYVFENCETGETKELAGSAVERDGFTLALPKREGVIWFYRVK